MTVLVMAVFDTDQNHRSWMTDDCLHSLSKTVDWDKHKLIVVSNGSCFDTVKIIKKWEHSINMHVAWNKENIGQAAAINQGWKTAREISPDHLLGRIDNDVQLQTNGWLDLLEQCVWRDPKIGIAALKHADLLDCPEQEGYLKTSYHTLPHKRGEKHIIIEKVNHCLGAVQLINPMLFEKIGYLDVLGQWGWEDHLYSVRCQLAGFYSAYCHVGHFVDLDEVKDATYQSWKDRIAQAWGLVHEQRAVEYRAGTRPLKVEMP